MLPPLVALPALPELVGVLLGVGVGCGLAAPDELLVLALSDCRDPGSSALIGGADAFTTITPFIQGCGTQKYRNVPGVSKV